MDNGGGVLAIMAHWEKCAGGGCDVGRGMNDPPFFMNMDATGRGYNNGN